jgi:hypothetical protein
VEVVSLTLLIKFLWNFIPGVKGDKNPKDFYSGGEGGRNSPLIKTFGFYIMTF